MEVYVEDAVDGEGGELLTRMVICISDVHHWVNFRLPAVLRTALQRLKPEPTDVSILSDDDRKGYTVELWINGQMSNEAILRTIDGAVRCLTPVFGPVENVNAAGPVPGHILAR